MKSYLLPEDDGLPIRSFGYWTAVKLDYLERYIDIFETSMRDKSWRRRNYIDLFAGTGKCRMRESGKVLLGSPLLSLTTSHPFTNYIFVDMSSENIQVLDERCSASPFYERIESYDDDSNEIVKKIVSEIIEVDNVYIPDVWSSLNLAFLDPDGLELKFETVATLSQPYSMDLIIHYPQGGLNRTMSKFYTSEELTQVDLFFGGTDWRDIYRQWKGKTGLQRHLMDHYKEKLQGLGYKEVLRDDETGDEPLMRNAREAPLYRLIFASKHELGFDFWHKVTRRDVHGQQRLPNF